MNTARTLLLSLVTFADGSIDTQSSILAATDLIEKESARETADFDSAASEVATLLVSPKWMALRSSPIGNIVDAIMARRVSQATRSFLAANPDADDDEVSNAVASAPGCTSADRDRLAEVLPAYFRQNSDQFHMGRRSGVSIRYAVGDNVKDQKSGREVKGDDGNPVQRYRFTDEEWTKITAVKESTAPAQDGTSAAA